MQILTIKIESGRFARLSVHVLPSCAEIVCQLKITLDFEIRWVSGRSDDSTIVIPIYY